MELVKCQMQTHGDVKGPMEVIKQIYRQAGFTGLNRGLTLTVLREVPGFAVYFGSYEIMIRKLGEKTPSVLFAGGMAGIFSWIATYPQDVIKSRIQADGFGAHQEYRNALHCLKLSYKNEGHQFLFRGIGSTVIRAFPMNAVTFGVYTQIMKSFAPQEADDYDTITSLKLCSQAFNILPLKAQNHWPVKKEYNGRIMHIATDTPNILTIQQPMANISYSRMYPETILAACPDRTPSNQVSAWERIRDSMDSNHQSESGYNLVDSISMHPSPEMIWMKAPKVENEVQEKEPAPPSLLVESKLLHKITTSDLLIPSNLFVSRRSLDKIYGFYYLMS